MTIPSLDRLVAGVMDGSVVPYIGPGIMNGINDRTSGEAMPFDGDSLILALNGGTPMAPRLMYEFSRAAMALELKKGRGYLNRTLNGIYQRDSWPTAPLHRWLADIKPPFVVDINRDTQLQESYSDRPHTLVRGISRIANDYRFVIHHYDGEAYNEIPQQQVDATLPILFKPMGSPLPDPTYIISDADYVDYITELMGGFAIPDFLKQYRQQRQYLLLGMRLTRDTERMVLSDITYAASEQRGWAMIAEPTAKERRYCDRIGFEVIESDWTQLLEAAGINELPRQSLKSA